MAENKVMVGLDVFKSMNEQDNGKGNSFSTFKSGTKYLVKVPEFTFISKAVYGIFKQTNSFVAESPSKKSARGYPIENYTPFDLAWKYYKDQSGDWQDELAQEAQKYQASTKTTVGFFDLDSGEPLMIEFTKNQADIIVEVISKNQKRLDQFAFELEKQGTGRNTVVSLTLVPIMDELTEKQQENFKTLPNEFNPELLEGLHYEMSDEEMIETLTKVGFDVSLIGFEAPKKGDESDEEGEENNEFDF